MARNRQDADSDDNAVFNDEFRLALPPLIKAVNVNRFVFVRVKKPAGRSIRKVSACGKGYANFGVSWPEAWRGGSSVSG